MSHSKYVILLTLVFLLSACSIKKETSAIEDQEMEVLAVHAMCLEQ